LATSLFDNAAVRAMVVNSRDVTERKQAEEGLREALRKAEESDRLKSAFLANVSHEIRTPLNIILGYNEILRDSLTRRTDEGELQLLSGIEKASHRLTNTVTGIVDLSKLESGTFEYKPAEIRPQESITRWVEEFRQVAKEKELSLTCQIEEPGATIVFDEYSLSRALFHLIDNAVKFTLTGSVSVRLFRRPDRLALEVRDTGIGIAEAYVPKLFRPFSQEEYGYTRDFEGPGIGLALTKRLVEINGGVLEFESAKGVGSVFTILLPEPGKRAAAGRGRGSSR
jgi:signal transduction histidine kinase